VRVFLGYSLGLVEVMGIARPGRVTRLAGNLPLDEPHLDERLTPRGKVEGRAGVVLHGAGIFSHNAKIKKHA
jgi:hypothetical protein